MASKFAAAADTLDHSKLNDVLCALKTFPRKKWMELGLNLGLYKETLDTIEVNYQNNVDRCLIETIDVWLRKADLVDTPTWKGLADVLDKMGVKTVADGIRTEYLIAKTITHASVPNDSEVDPLTDVISQIAIEPETREELRRFSIESEERTRPIAQEEFCSNKSEETTRQITQEEELKILEECDGSIMVERNVLIMGPVGSGNSTLGNHILGYNKFCVGTQRKIRKAPISSGICQYDYNNVRYQVTVFVINLPDDDNLETEGKTTIIPDNQIDLVDQWHLIIFVAKEGKFTEEAMTRLSLIGFSYPASVFSIGLLVITGCEGKNKEKILKKYRSDPETEVIINCMGKGVLAVGFPDLSQCYWFLRSKYAKGIKDDEEALRKIISESSEAISKEELSKPIYSSCCCLIL